MRSILPLSLVCFALALMGCGNNAFEFKSLSAEPSGEKITIAYDMKPGDGVRMKMRMSGKMKMSGVMDMTVPLDITMQMTFACLEVRDNGDKVIEMAIDAASMDLGEDLPKAAGADLLEGFKATMTVDKTGRVKDTNLEGLGMEVQSQVSQMLNNPGFQYFVPMPEGGMQVGEALDLAKIMPKEAMQQLMNQAMAGGSITPDLKGEIVLQGTRDFGGERAAQFDINMVMNIQGSMSKGGTEAEMDIGMKVVGTQFNSLRTGFPVGEASWTMEMRGEIDGGGQEMEMEMDATMSITCTPLK